MRDAKGESNRRNSQVNSERAEERKKGTRMNAGGDSGLGMLEKP